MGFNLLSAIGGAAKTYVTEMEREEERQSALEDKMKLMYEMKFSVIGFY